MSALYVIDTIPTGIHVTTEGYRLGSPQTTSCVITALASAERLVTT
jgi:hypothetical protein